MKISKWKKVPAKKKTPEKKPQTRTFSGELRKLKSRRKSLKATIRER